MKVRVNGVFNSSNSNLSIANQTFRKTLKKETPNQLWNRCFYIRK